MRKHPLAKPQPARKNRLRLRRLAVLALTAWGAYLRWPDADYWYSGDEAHYWAAATSASFPELLEEIRYHAHPPLYFILLWCWSALGADIWWLRLPALLSGTLLIPLTYVWVRGVSGSGAALAAALLVTLSPIGIVLSQVVRPYTLLLVLLVLTLHGLTVYVRTARPVWGLVFATAMVAALLIHYCAFIVLAGLSVYLLALVAARTLAGRRMRVLMLALTPSVAIAIVLYRWRVATLLAPGGLRDLAVGSMHTQFIASLGGLVRNFREVTDVGLGVGQGPLAAILVVIGLGAALYQRNWAASLLPGAVLGLGAALSALQVYPFGPTRHAVYLLPMLVLPAAHALASLIGARQRWLLALGLGAAGSIALSGARLASTGLGPHLSRVPVEHDVRMNEAETVRKFLLDDGTRAGVFLSDKQTYWLLRPLLGLVGRAGWPSQVDGNQIKLVTWQARPLLILDAWQMAGASVAEPGPDHLAWMLTRLDRQERWKHRLESREVWVIQGGGGAPLNDEVPEQTARGEQIRSPTVGGTRFFAFRLYPAAYRAYATGTRD